MFGPEHPSGPSKPGHDFVGNQQRIGAITPFTHSPQGSGRPKPHPGGSLNERLDHYGGNLRHLRWRKSLQGSYIRNLNCGEIPVTGSDMEHRRSAEAGRARRIPVVTALECNELMFSRISRPRLSRRRAPRPSTKTSGSCSGAHHSRMLVNGCQTDRLSISISSSVFHSLITALLLD